MTSYKISKSWSNFAKSIGLFELNMKKIMKGGEGCRNSSGSHIGVSVFNKVMNDDFFWEADEETKIKYFNDNLKITKYKAELIVLLPCYQ